MDLTKLNAGDVITYTGDSLAYGGSYIVHRAEDTYENESDVPENEKGVLFIVEFTNDDMPMFFDVTQLNADEWSDMPEEWSDAGDVRESISND